MGSNNQNMDNTEVKERLLTDFFANYPLGAALYDSKGNLIELNRAICEQFRIHDKREFLLDNLFESNYLSDLQKEHLLQGNAICDNCPVDYTIVPSEGTSGEVIGYTLLLTGSGSREKDVFSYNHQVEELKVMSEKVAESVPDTILLVNNQLIVERIIAYATETCITPEAINHRIDDLPGFIYPDDIKQKMVLMVRRCLETSEVQNIDLSIPGHNAPVIYFQLRLVPMLHKYVVIYIRNVSQLIEKEKENKDLNHRLSESRTMMELALLNSKISTYSFNFERFRTCNKVNCNHCFQFYGVGNSLLKKNQYICRALTVLRHPEDRSDFFLLFNEIRNKKLKESSVNFRLKEDDGTFRSYEVMGKAQEYDAEGFPNLIIGCIIDNQERVEYEESLIRAKEKAENADLLKSTFLANMTHEIRTPLNAIVGFSDLLSFETDPEMRENYINLIKANNELLLSLINDVLDISKIESGMMSFAYTDVDLPSLMRDVQSMMQFRVPPGVEFVLDPCPELVFNIDQNRLVQILSNLLTNAMKYTSAGKISFGYRIVDDWIYFHVSDTGTGIPPEKKEKIFARFVQLDGHKQGIGLGLAICKGLVAKMGGDISVESEVGKGSVFRFTLPIQRPNSWKSEM